MKLLCIYDCEMKWNEMIYDYEMDMSKSLTKVFLAQ